MAKLTTKSIENMKPAADRREVPDGGCRGLYLVVQPSGARGWAVRYRYQGKPRKLTLGVWPVLQLAAARSAASAALHELAQGRDPAALKFEAEAAAAKAEIDRKADTIESWAKHFLDRHAAKKREHTERQYRHVIEDFALPAWRGRTVHDIKRRDVINLVEGIAETKPVMANRALVVIGTFFGWLCSRDVIETSPVVGVKAPAKEQARERPGDAMGAARSEAHLRIRHGQAWREAAGDREVFEPHKRQLPRHRRHLSATRLRRREARRPAALERPPRRNRARRACGQDRHVAAGRVTWLARELSACRLLSSGVTPFTTSTMLPSCYAPAGQFLSKTTVFWPISWTARSSEDAAGRPASPLKPINWLLRLPS
jgi:hypothetical protein